MNVQYRCSPGGSSDSGGWSITGGQGLTERADRGEAGDAESRVGMEWTVAWDTACACLTVGVSGPCYMLVGTRDGGGEE